jgi:PAS domain S-box-containing protein
MLDTEEMFRQVVETAYEGVWIIDPDGRIAFANPRIAEILEWPREALVGRSLEDFVFDALRAEALLAQARRMTEATHEVHSLELRTQTGERRVALLSSSPFLDSTGRLRGTLAMITDVTDRVEAEERLRELKTELEEKVRERTAELADTNRSLSAAVAEMEAFTYSVSHDLRGPLRALDGFSQAVLEDYGERLDETGRDYLERIRTASQRLGSLMDDLLKLSRVGREAVRRTPVELGEMAEALLERSLRSEPERPLEAVIAPDLRVEADEGLMEILLDNLIGNALKFTRDRDPARIEVGWSDRESGVIRVRDNGVGFDPQYADKLFLPFQRLHPKRDFEGNGIGLATVRRIVEMHGGEIRATGLPDEGATFEFTLHEGEER